jgi:Ca2+-binding RTX toxin-like protein
VHGGGLTLRFPDGSNAMLTNSTVHANTAPVGGGIAAGLTEPLTLRYTTVTGNAGPTGANVASSSLTSIGASVVAEPAGGGTNCAPFPGFGTNFVSEGYSWFSDASCAAGPTDVVVPGGDPQLDALGDNGGPTPTRLPELSSPLGGLVPTGSCAVPTDQRGETRPAGADCEAGAVEIEETSALILGTPGRDLLLGTPADDEIRGLGGSDLLIGHAGADLLLGGPGNDILIGGPGDDTLSGGPGNDLLVGGPGHDTYDGGSGFDLCLRPGRILPKVC